MIKKLMVICLSFVMLFSLVACGSDKNNDSDQPTLNVEVGIDDVVKAADKAVADNSLSSSSWEVSTEFIEDTNTYVINLQSAKASFDLTISVVWTETEAKQVCGTMYDSVSNLFKNTGVDILVNVKSSSGATKYTYDGNKVTKK